MYEHHNISTITLTMCTEALIFGFSTKIAMIYRSIKNIITTKSKNYNLNDYWSVVDGQERIKHSTAYHLLIFYLIFFKMVAR